MVYGNDGRQTGEGDAEIKSPRFVISTKSGQALSRPLATSRQASASSTNTTSAHTDINHSALFLFCQFAAHLLNKFMGDTHKFGYLGIAPIGTGSIDPSLMSASAGSHSLGEIAVTSLHWAIGA